MTSARLHDRCIFCGGDEVTHLIADWVLRAFYRARRPPVHLSGSLRGQGQLSISPAPAVSTAEVLCRECNNTWVSRIDNGAARALRPLIAGKDTVALNERAQSAVAAWIFKTALIFDAVAHGVDGVLGHLRPAFFADRVAAPGIAIHVGPAPRMPFKIETIPEVAQLMLFGVRSVQGSVKATVNVQAPDGSPISTVTQTVPTPGWTVMLGRMHAIISGRRGPIIPTPEWRYGCVWPTAGTVTLTSDPPDGASVEAG